MSQLLFDKAPELIAAILMAVVPYVLGLIRARQANKDIERRRNILDLERDATDQKIKVILVDTVNNKSIDINQLRTTIADKIKLAESEAARAEQAIKELATQSLRADANEAKVRLLEQRIVDLEKSNAKTPETPDSQSVA